jgi:benzoyl-CoA reductase subunit C
MSAASEIIARCEEIHHDLTFSTVRGWKAEVPGRKAVGFMPIYVPREIAHAAGILPVGIVGGGDELEVIRGDAYFQSYICRIPRSTIELGVSERLDCLDGMLFPSICDVIRNLSGIWKMLFPETYVRYVDVPQDYDPKVGGRFYRAELARLAEDFAQMTGSPVDDDALRAAIVAYNENRRLVRSLYDLRAAEPWRVSISDAYLLLKAGLVLPVEDHSTLLGDYLDAVAKAEARPRDDCRIVVVGTFCEQPPLNLLRTLERSGAYVVDDDLLLVSRWHTEAIPEDGDPLQNLAEAFLTSSEHTAARYEDKGEEKGAYLVEKVRRLSADGVIFASPSFCDPALLDRPMLQKRLDAAGIPHTSFKYAENTGQLGPILEQAGTFADAIKLWGAA